ncbi:MAG: AAA family ATPase [bacterium]
MYEIFYGFNEKPFTLSPDPQFFCMSSVHKRAMSYLKYGIKERKGFIVISGEVGSGKTTLIRTLLTQMEENASVINILNPTQSSKQILKEILNELSPSIFNNGQQSIINGQNGSKADLINLSHNIFLKKHNQGQHVILIFDEAQLLKISTLEEIRLLSNLETNKYKLVQIILVGQPELLERLNSSVLKQLKQRISVRFHITPLDIGETKKYVSYRLKAAGLNKENIFTDKALKAIYKYSGGIPRLINTICDTALLAGYAEEIRIIDYFLIEESIAELEFDLHKNKGDEGGIKENQVVSGSLSKNGNAFTTEILGKIYERINNLHDLFCKQNQWQKDLEEREMNLKIRESVVAIKLTEIEKIEAERTRGQEDERRKRE